ncbi:hypothetical protein SCLCIDRAFT_1045688 [Scleroderma citrinum Foug A]|uniref:Uncharacterized protein n=1 Tax=Scleroderma citrinum Foug A TaxID=1036808 RepID=A0A0C3DSJ5_9AGAM|nr:hypothetical protein SCLCIDRAFT_1045688 [Scleroderma citrinum Foug A]
MGATSVVDGAAKAGALRLEVGGPADGGGKAEGGDWISGSRKLRSRTKFADIPERWCFPAMSSMYIWVHDDAQWTEVRGGGSVFPLAAVIAAACLAGALQMTLSIRTW